MCACVCTFVCCFCAMLLFQLEMRFVFLFCAIFLFMVLHFQFFKYDAFKNGTSVLYLLLIYYNSFFLNTYCWFILSFFFAHHYFALSLNFTAIRQHKRLSGGSVFFFEVIQKQKYIRKVK